MISLEIFDSGSDRLSVNSLVKLIKNGSIPKNTGVIKYRSLRRKSFANASADKYDK
jgi:hypothetical protein